MPTDASTLPRWRYIIRQALLPLIRAETPPLADMQRLFRTPVLDSYFAFSANLGTHTFFMLFLPLLFWCDYGRLGRALVNLLASGVIVSGIIKDLFCLPRPVSPPLQRITMSGSAALEYGFPSTHTTNAVSVALYLIWFVADQSSTISSEAKVFWTAFCYLYAGSIAFGRLYCGMHGFTDVVAGGALGALLTFCEIGYGDEVYNWIISGSFTHPLILTLFLFVVIRTHPEPADNCPCFDDSVAFSGVVIGINFAEWNSFQTHSVMRLMAFVNPNLTDMPVGVPVTSMKTLFRIPIGVAIIVAFRSITKPFLFRLLPPLFRFLESLDLDLPRRYFLKASEYRTVPKLQHDDNVLPNASEVGQMIGDVRRRRGRAISVGPQSVADAYEVLAYRKEERRRERSISATRRDPNATAGAERYDREAEQMVREAEAKSLPNEDSGEDEVEDARERKVVFSGLPRTRVRYDVEVITKLIIYTGIGWWALEGCPVVFELFGLGVDNI